MAEESQSKEDTTKTEDTNVTSSPSTAQAGNENIVAALAYLGILFFLPLVVTPESKFGRFHANQGLVLLLLSVVLNFVVWTFAWVVPFLFFFIWIGWILVFVLAVMGFVNALNGKQEELPVIGGINLINK